MLGSRIQRYIFRKCVVAFLMVMGLFTITILLVDVVEQLRTVGEDVNLSPFSAAFLSLKKLPTLIEQTLPFGILVAAMMTYNQLNKSSELSVIRAMGQSAWQFLAPIMVLGVGLGFLSMMVLNPLGASLSEDFQRSRADLLREGGKAVSETRENIWLAQGTNGSADGQITIYAQTVDDTGQIFQDLKFIEQTRVFDGAIPTERFEFVRRIDAARARIIDGFWKIEDLVEMEPGKLPRSMDELSIETDLDPNKLLSLYISPETTGFWALPDFIQQTSRAGLDTSRFRMKWYELTALPLLYTAMGLIGAIVCLRLNRLGGTSQLVATGAFAAVTLFFITQITSSFGSSGAISPLIAAWSPALCAFFISMTILAYQEDG